MTPDKFNESISALLMECDLASIRPIREGNDDYLMDLDDWADALRTLRGWDGAGECPAIPAKPLYRAMPAIIELPPPSVDDQ